MKSKFYVFINIFICLQLTLLTGCDTISEYSFAKIKSPTLKSAAIEGVWKVTNIKKNDENIEASLQINDHLYFENNIAIIKDQKYDNVTYKYKDVNVNQYMLYNYKVNSSNISLRTNDSGILSLSSNDRLLYEFMNINKSNLIMYGNGTIYYLQKDDNFNINSIKIHNYTYSAEDSKVPKGDSGILLGIRNSDSQYRTVWIEYNGEESASTVECNNLLVPRNKGFWVVGLKDIGKRKSIFASRVEAYKNNATEANSINISATNDHISFVGNDYIFLEYNNGVRALPIDSLTSKKGLKISDILGEAGKENMETSFNAMVANNDQLKLSSKPNEQNFILVRKNGHWIMQGRIYDRNSDNYWSYDMNLTPPTNMLSYDELSISWNKVLEKIPDAVDIFTSPNNQLALVVTQSEIQAFKISKGELENNPIAHVYLKSDDHIIMSEWALDEYVENWQNMISSLSTLYKK